MRFPAFAVVIALAACGTRRVMHDPGVAPDPQGQPQQLQTADDIVPTLAIVTPDRGVFADAATILVSGRAHDDGAVRVTVNGVEAVIAPDGAFTATVIATPGLAIIETHAIDTTGHDTRDVRSVLVGPFATADGSVHAPLAVRVGRTGLASLAKALGASAKSIDVNARARSLNPIFNNSGCLGARADITNVTIGKVEVALAPKFGALATTILVDDIVARFDVHYEVACLGGSTTMTVRTNARIASEIAATVRDRRVRTSLSNTTVTLDALQIDISGVPGPVEDLLRRAIRGSVEQALQTVVAISLPPIADAKLGELLAHPAAPILGHDVSLDVIPRRFDIAAAGVTVAADAAIVVAGGERGRHVARPATLPALETPPADADVWVAPDATNQLLAGLWSAHAFDRTIALSELGVMGMLLAGKIQSIEVTHSLPPTIGATADLEIAIGDLILLARDANGAEVQRFAVSLRGAPTAEPTVFAQELGRGGAGPLDSTAVETISKSVWSIAMSMIENSLGGTVKIRSATARSGFVVLDLAAAE